MTLPAGLHYNVPEDVYRSDPCPEPSLTQSIAKTLVNLTPAHYKYAKPEPTTKFDIGLIAHRLILGRGREIEVLGPEFGDWKKKDARTARDNGAENGKLVVLAKDMDTASEMTQAAFRQLIDDRGYGSDWILPESDPSRAEVVAIASVHNSEWRGKGHPAMDVWLRALIDWLPSLARIWDIKTTGMPAAQSIRTSLPDWCIQAAMHERILNILDPASAGRREHRFVVQEDFEPYALQVVRLTEAHLTVGRRQIAQAEAIWARCVATDRWPAYPLEDQSPEYPGWKLAQVMEGGDDRG